MTNTSHEVLVPRLVEVGLTRNEALAYLTLLEDHGEQGLTGYEVAARSGIPRSAVYTTLRKLEGNGGAFATGADPVRFVPTDPDVFIAKNRRETMAKLDTLSDALEGLPKRVRPEPVWLMQRYGEVMQQIATMVRSAEHSIYLSMWPRELEVIADDLDATLSRDLHRVLHSPARIPTPPEGFSTWLDDLAGDEAKATWSHKALVVIDRTRALIGGTEPGATNHAVITTNPSLVDLATNNIILDITLLAAKQGLSCGDDVAPMMRPHLSK